MCIRDRFLIIQKVAGGGRYPGQGGRIKGLDGFRSRRVQKLPKGDFGYLRFSFVDSDVISWVGDAVQVKQKALEIAAQRPAMNRRSAHIAFPRRRFKHLADEKVVNACLLYTSRCV